jgi:hypothetical protein
VQILRARRRRRRRRRREPLRGAKGGGGSRSRCNAKRKGAVARDIQTADSFATDVATAASTGHGDRRRR